MVNSKHKSLPTSRNKSSHNLSINAKKLIDMNELILQLNELKSLQKLIKQNKPIYIKT